MFQEGEPFPALAFPLVDGGGAVTLSNFRGRKVILQLFASW